VFIQKLELWVKISNLKFCVGRDLNLCKIFLHEFVCIDKPEPCVKIGHIDVLFRERP